MITPAPGLLFLKCVAGGLTQIPPTRYIYSLTNIPIQNTNIITINHRKPSDWSEWKDGKTQDELHTPKMEMGWIGLNSYWSRPNLTPFYQRCFPNVFTLYGLSIMFGKLACSIMQNPHSCFAVVLFLMGERLNIIKPYDEFRCCMYKQLHACIHGNPSGIITSDQ